MADPVIEVRGTADFSGLNRALGQADSSIGRSTSSWRKLGSVVKTGALAAAAGASALAAVGVKLAQGAAEDQASQVRLATALRNTTGARSKDIAGVEQYISAQGRALGVTDDELRPALGQLAAATGSVTKAQKLTSLALDVSAGRGLKLSSVTKTLERAQLGNVTSLGKLGVKTKDAEGNTRSLQAITAELARTYKGQASEAANTAAGQYQRLKVAFNEAGESIGYKLLPLGQKFADFALTKLIPAAGKLSKAFDKGGLDGGVKALEKLTGTQGKLTPILDDGKKAVDGLVRIAKELGPAFLGAAEALPPFTSPLKIAGTILDALANVLEFVPDGVKTLGIEAGLAAVLMGKISSATTRATAAFTTGTGPTARYYATLRYGASSSQAAAAGAVKLAGAARSAAGVGGILALTASANQSNDAVTLLGATAGGALLGFSLGGPFGAAIGAGAGALYGLATNASKSKDALKESIPVAANYASTLDGLTGAITAQTRAAVFQSAASSGALTQARQLGVSSRDVVNAVLGEEGALRRVSTALNAAKDYTATYTDVNGNAQSATFRTADGVEKLRRRLVLQGIAYDSVKVSSENAAKTGLSGFIGRETDARVRDTQATRDQIQASQDLTVLRGKIPKVVYTKLQQTGIEPTIRGIARVVAQNKLVDKKQIRAVISASGIDATVKQVRRVLTAMNDTSKAHPDLRQYVRGIEDGISGGKRAASRGSTELVDLLRGGTRKARADLSGFGPSVTRGLGPAKGAASAGGVSIGGNLKSGVIRGFAGTQAALSAQAAYAVSSAIRAARAAAQIKSPSRKTAYVGRMLGAGLVVGMEGQQGNAARGGRNLIRAALAGITAGSDGVSKALEKLDKLIDKRTDDKRGKAILRNLRDESGLLKANGREQDRNTAKLEKARDKYRELVSGAKEYAASIRDAVVANASVVGLGVDEQTQAVTASSILAGVQQRFRETVRFYQAIQSLRGRLNATSLQQILDAGVSGGLATAEALASATATELKDLNNYTQSIANVGTELGSSMATQFKAAGISAAAGLVAGLEQEQKQLDKVAERIGATIVRAIKKALGIKSPSRVLRAVGDQAMAGLSLGLDDTYARTLGARVGAGVVAGVGRPQLTLDTSTSGTLSPADAALLTEIRLMRADLRGVRTATEDAPELYAKHLTGAVIKGRRTGGVLA